MISLQKQPVIITQEYANTRVYFRVKANTRLLLEPSEIAPHEAKLIKVGPTPGILQSTTSVLTAAILVYTAGAGITAAAGTRLALLLILTEHFGNHPLRATPAQGTCDAAIVRRCLTHLFAMGNLRTCCQP